MKSVIQQSEEQYWKGMETHNYELVKNLTGFPCFIAGKNGIRSVDESMFKKMFDGHKNIEIAVKSVTDMQSRMLSEEIGVIIYQVEVAYSGKPMKFACTSTWKRDDSQWKCIVHSETPLEN